MRAHALLASFVGASVALFASTALASNGLESPDVGVLQIGRGGAWVARADDPLAAYMNPAAMSFQASGVHLGTQLMIQRGCFSRLGADGQPQSPGNNIPGPGATGGPEPETCTTSVFPNPQIAGVFRINREWAVGLAVLGPHAAGTAAWPEEVEYTTQSGAARTQPAPNRYMLADQSAVLVFPTFSVSYAVLPELSIGAGFVWGISSAEFVTFTEALSGAEDFSNDVRAKLNVEDLFVPGFVLGVNWGVTSFLDFGAWYRWSDAIRARTELELTSSYWLEGGTRNQSPCANNPDNRCNITFDGDAGDFEFAIPMEAKLGLRFHMPIGEDTVQPAFVQREGFVRDPLTQERFDIEVDVTWANNSAVQDIIIQFDPGIAVKGTPGTVPVDGNIPHDWRDVLGVRLGGDVTAIPNLLALRAGGFFESKGQRDELLNLDFHMGWKAGVGGGATVRVWQVDIHAAYQHVFYGTLDNGGDGELKALSGEAPTFRSVQPVNGGKFEQSLNEIGLGATARF